MGLGDRVLRRGRDVRISVVVAVYNTGKYIEPCLDSLLAQSLSPSEFEVILVDDGSDDGVTALRIDEAAAHHDNVTAIHIPNSGWPGKPRNVGIEASRGEYVYFLDHDDSLAPEALERMYDMASRNKADVVIGKIAGHGRRVPTTLFRRNYESCTLETAPLMESMTPHKGFRRAFLDEHGIRFPEGRRRLEDHVFVIEAYLLANTVSVLSDYTCYHHIARDDAGNAGFQAIEPGGYYGNLREAIDIAERLTDPGPRRDLVLRRWYGVEMLRRVSGKVFANLSPGQRKAMYREIRTLALERFTRPSIWEPLPAPARVVSELLRADRYDDLVALAEFASSLTLRVDVVRWEWHRGRLAFEAIVSSQAPDGRPALTVRDGVALYAAHLTGVSSGASQGRQRATAGLELRLRGADARHVLPLELAPSTAEGPLTYQLRGWVDPSSTGASPLLTGVWDVFLRLRDADAGPDQVRRVGSEHGVVSAPPPPAALVGSTTLVVVPYVTEKGNLSLDIGEKTKDLVSAIAAGGPSVVAVAPVSDGSVEVRAEVPLHVSRRLDESDLRLTSVLFDGVEISAPLTAAPGPQADVTVLEASLPELAASGRLSVSWSPSDRKRLVPLLAAPPPAQLSAT